MTLVSNFDLSFHSIMEELCENVRSIAHLVIKLQLVKIKELDVCESLNDYVKFGQIYKHTC